MKNFVQDKLSWIVLVLFVIFIVCCLMVSKDPLPIKVNSEELYNLLTVNTIFSGFLYTMLGNLVEFNSRKDISQKDYAGYIDRYYSPVYFGLFFFIVAIALEASILFFGIRIQIMYLLFLQKIFSVLGILYFVISTIMLRKMINQVRNIK
ncbi:hypothetical protein [Carnobacterium divergens]|uniref:hypothetical protein n=1 Tax=Carnobacterium divergens TaxID=2748 RepID=UPI0028921E2F|nr:hypothetical protein [Carnobacterium divergens]MDT2011132.1 hypothetical protein [Carnobacterium divergens]